MKMHRAPLRFRHDRGNSNREAGVVGRDAIFCGTMELTESIAKKAYESLTQFLLALAGLLFLTFWSFRVWQMWLFWAVFAAGVIGITAYFLEHDPGLIARRLKAGASAETLPPHPRDLLRWQNTSAAKSVNRRACSCDNCHSEL